MKINKLIENVLNGTQVNIQDAVEFITLVHTTLYPDKPYNEGTTITALYSPYRDQIFHEYINLAIENSTKFNIQVTQLHDLKQNKLIKTIVK